MTTTTIREVDADRDTDATAALVTTEFDFILHNAASMRHQTLNRDPAQHALELVAEIDGEIVGTGSFSLDPENSLAGAANLRVIVAPQRRRAGVGTALYEKLRAHGKSVGATSVTTRLASQDGARFAQKHGFAQSRTERISRLDLADLPAPSPVSEGITLKAQSELDDYRALYDIDSATFVDIPADEPWQTLDFDQWLKLYSTDPRLDHACTTLAFDGDVPVAVAWLDGVDTRVWSSLTATRREYRGRGLAKAVKSAALQRARDRGAVVAYTNNDATNAGMLAVNDRLGYQLHVDLFAYVKTNR